jgi:hypothetical protein
LEGSTVSNLDLGGPAPRKRPAPAQPQPSRHDLVVLWLSQFSATLAAHLVAVAILLTASYLYIRYEVERIGNEIQKSLKETERKVKEFPKELDKPLKPKAFPKELDKLLKPE